MPGLLHLEGSHAKVGILQPLAGVLMVELAESWDCLIAQVRDGVLSKLYQYGIA